MHALGQYGYPFTLSAIATKTWLASFQPAKKFRVSGETT